MKKEKNKGSKNIYSIIISLFLIGLLVLLGLLAFSRFGNAPEQNSVTDELPEGSNLVEGNTFSFNGIICKTKTENECTKELRVSYNKKNHNIKIKRIKRTTSSSTIIKNEIYVDDKLMDTVDGGAMYEGADKYKSDFDGYIFIGDSKYLIIVTPFMVDEYTNYVVNYYDNGKKLGRGVDIINGEQTICKGSCDKNGEIMNDLEALDFDGKVLKYWKPFCTKHEKEALQIGITVENKTVTTKYLDTDKKVEIKGACS